MYYPSHPFRTPRSSDRSSIPAWVHHPAASAGRSRSMLWFPGLLDAAWPWRHKSVQIWMLQLRSNQIGCQQARPGLILFYKLGASGSCRARVELKVWGVKEHPQWEDEEQRAAAECEGGVEWDEKDCWLKRARPNGWVDRADTDWVKNRVALFCFPPSLMAGLQPSAVTTTVSTSSLSGSPPASIFLTTDNHPTAHDQHLPTEPSTTGLWSGRSARPSSAQSKSVSHLGS